jgi:Cu(I)/Ag(I) efflux system membrane fusion protein
MFLFIKTTIRFALRHRITLLMLAVVSGAAAVIWSRPQLRAHAITLSGRVLEWAGVQQQADDANEKYWCPMHPQIKRSNENEVCPICNMALVPLQRNTGDLTLTARQVQQAGVATEAVIRRKLYREIDTTGRLDYDERRYAGISCWVPGKSRVDELHVNFTGDSVEEGELIASIYSPALITAQEEFLLTLEDAETRRDRTTRGPIGLDADTFVNSARQKLLNQGMTADQVDRLAETRQVLERVPVLAPISGTVIERHVQEGQYVEEGEWLFHLADLSHLWLFVDIYEEELFSVHEEQLATVTVLSLPGETFAGPVAFIDREVQPETRTVRVRIDIDNSDGRLKPNMYARVRLRNEFPEVLAVPENAVLQSGQRAVAVVREGDGLFQPRELRIGQRWLYPSDVGYRPGGVSQFGEDRIRYHEVLEGLAPGEDVVTAGAFLLNAEAQFKSVLTKMLPPTDQPASLEQAMGEEVAATIRAVLDAYFDLTTSLTEDKLEPIRGQASALAAAARDLATQAESSNLPGLERSATQLAEHADTLTGDVPDDLHAARVGFGRISHEMFVLLNENGGATLFGQDVFAFHCGMAKVGYENWLWWSPEKHNPYMGQRMLTCGTPLETLDPAGGAPASQSTVNTSGERQHAQH